MALKQLHARWRANCHAGLCNRLPPAHPSRGPSTSSAPPVLACSPPHPLALPQSPSGSGGPSRGMSRGMRCAPSRGNSSGTSCAPSPGMSSGTRCAPCPGISTGTRCAPATAVTQGASGERACTEPFSHPTVLTPSLANPGNTLHTLQSLLSGFTVTCAKPSAESEPQFKKCCWLPSAYIGSVRKLVLGLQKAHWSTDSLQNIRVRGLLLFLFWASTNSKRAFWHFLKWLLYNI